MELHLLSNLKVLYPGTHYYAQPVDSLDRWRLSKHHRDLDEELANFQLLKKCSLSIQIFAGGQTRFFVNHGRRSRSTFLFLLARAMQRIINDRRPLLRTATKKPDMKLLLHIGADCTYNLNRIQCARDQYVTALEENLNIQFI